MSNRLKVFLLITVLAVISINYSDGLRGFSNDISAFVVKTYADFRDDVSNSISEYFDQRDEIRILKSKNIELDKKVLELTSISDKFNAMLREAKLSKYAPQTKLVRALSYVNLGDYNKIWLDFDGFDASKIYGLIYEGYTAGIVTSSNERALAFLQYDPKSTFSVYIGKNKIKGIAFGANDRIEIRYIPLWTEPKEGNEVITSGLDNIFFEGIKVGKVVSVQKDESYFMAVVKPYANINVPSFFHVVLKD
ncbi:MAG: rod shape-determining protein MreC [Campylobacteraceae bacterium]|jgi:rod shape-determining protein MreC|nr:rod shape-determining protein MreC [Campylobacteraceae bacterium]